MRANVPAVRATVAARPERGEQELGQEVRAEYVGRPVQFEPVGADLAGLQGSGGVIHQHIEG